MFGKHKRSLQVDRLENSADGTPVLNNDIIATTSVLNYILSHSKGDKRPHLQVNIYGIDFLGLLDSGCSKTVLGSQGWKVLKGYCNLIQSDLKSCTVANGNSCEVIGSVLLPLSLRDRVKVFEVLVIPCIPHSIILGVDFWVGMNIIPDLNSGEWYFREQAEIDINAVDEFGHLTSDQKKQLDELVEKTFSQMGDKLGCTTLVEHEIRTQSPPIKQRHYPLSPALQAHVNQELEKMLADDIIEPSNSPWASPIVLVKKSDGSYRFCVNYKKLNEVSLPDAYPMPFVSASLDKLKDARYLSTIDIKSAYWQIPVAKESRPYTAFVVPTRGLFQFKRMPFGLHNAPSTWQRFIDRVLKHDLEQYTTVYLDDVIISTPTFSKHIEVLGEVFKRLTSAGLTFNRDKCHFCKSELKYLGHVVTSAGLMVDPDKVEAVLKIPTPKSVTEVRRVLGLASWYRRFVPNFSTLVAPLTNLLHKNQRFVWTDECTKAFTRIKDHLVSAPILACPDFSKQFYVQTDASDFGLGAVLTQFHEDGEKVICYLSRSLTKTERRCLSVTEKECLAVIFAIEKLRGYLEGAHFTVITDHYSLKWLFSIKDPVGRIARWAVRLQQYSFDIVHRSGRENVVPDTLSRSVPVVDSISPQPSDTVTSSDKWYARMLTLVESKPRKFPLWRIENGKLFKRAKVKYPDLRGENEWLIVVPKDQRTEVIQKCHDLPTSGHLGVQKTLGRISSQWYWPKMRADVAKYIRRCDTCLRTKPEQKAPIGHMLSKVPSVSKPWQLASADIVGPLPRSSGGYSYILSICDCFSKFVLLFPLRKATALTITKLIEEHVILVFGAPNKIITDNGTVFRSRLFQEKMKEYQIKIAYTAAYHPQANPVERIHRVVKTMLSSYVGDNHKTWDKYLAKVGWAIRSAKHEVTGLTPNFINFGREIRVSGEHQEPVGDEINIVRDGSERKKSNGLEQVFTDVSKRLKAAYDKSRVTYNLRHRDEKFVLGQKVYKRNYVLSDATRNFTSKLAFKFAGPFVISKIISPWTYQLKDESGREIGIWHAKDLKAHPPDE